MNLDKVNIEGQWKQFLLPFLISSQFKGIYTKLREEHANGARIYPNSANFWKPFKCSYEDLKVIMIVEGPHNGVIKLGGLNSKWDEYSPLSTHTKLDDYWYSAIEQDIYGGMNLLMFPNPDFSFLVEQGILMLNSSFTAVEEGGSHFSLWEPFIAYLIEHVLNPYPTNLLYILIGEEALHYKKYISKDAIILECEHPQTAIEEKRSWNFNNIFSKTNEFLKKERNEEIIWVEQIPF